MSQQFDICKMESDGSLRLIEGTGDVERARARVKKLAAFSPGEYIIANRQTGERISIKSPVKQIVFQIGYDEKDLNARAELFRRCGHQVMSVAENEAAKWALTSIQNVDVFVVGHTAPEETRKEMVDWLKANFPKIKVVALIPSASRPLASADFNIVLNDWDERSEEHTSELQSRLHLVCRLLLEKKKNRPLSPTPSANLVIRCIAST